MARSHSSQRWLSRQAKDVFVQQAKSCQYRARSAFKLQEIQDKYLCFRKGMNVLDLGAAPGGFSQLAAQWVKPTGNVIAIDKLAMTGLSGVTSLQGDITTRETMQLLETHLQGSTVDVVMSDMAPNASGNKTRDQAQAMHLVDEALAIASDYLSSNGCFITKVFDGCGHDTFVRTLREIFDSVLIFKPKSSRSASREHYLIARGYNKRVGWGNCN